MIAEIWVDLDEGFGTNDKGDIYPGVYIASAISKLNSNRAVISLRRDRKSNKFEGPSATQWIDSVSVKKVEFSIADSTEKILSQKRRVREVIGTDHMAESNKSVILKV
jgi:hypothetical protein